jgi:hypothetical protein
LHGTLLDKIKEEMNLINSWVNCTNTPPLAVESWWWGGC